MTKIADQANRSYSVVESDSPALLILNEWFTPTWKTRVNGKNQPLRLRFLLLPLFLIVAVVQKVRAFDNGQSFDRIWEATIWWHTRQDAPVQMTSFFARKSCREW
jgi:hypothetical protein